MSRSIGARFGLSLFCAAFCAAAVGCSHRSSELTEWTAADHHHQNEAAPKSRSRHATVRTAGNATYTPPSQNHNLLVEVTWVKQCSSCHGKRGRGDGPNAAMFKPRDLSQPEWQESVKDEDIIKVIRDGRNKMPAFNFPDSMLTDMVAHIRTLGKNQNGSRAAAAAAGAEAENEGESEEAKPSAQAPANPAEEAKPGQAAPSAAAKPPQADARKAPAVAPKAASAEPNAAR